MWLLLYSGGGDGRGFLRFGSTTGSSRVIQNKKRQVGILENKNDYTQHYISTMMDETRIKLYQVVMKHAGNEEDRQHTYFSIFFFSSPHRTDANELSVREGYLEMRHIHWLHIETYETPGV